MKANFQIINRGALSASVLDETATEKIEKPIALKNNIILTAVQPLKVEPSPVVSAFAAIPLIKPATSVKAENIRFIDPAIASNISIIVSPQVGVPREKLTVPISPSADITDEMLFENPADQAKKLYLPRYFIPVQDVSGSSQFKISLEKTGDGGSLTIYLDKRPAPTIEAESRSSSELEHQVAVLLRYRIKGSVSALKELSFEEVTLEQSGIKAVLNLDSLPELNEIYNAMTQADYESELIVRRVFRVAIPVGTSGKCGTQIFQRSLMLKLNPTITGISDRGPSPAAFKDPEEFIHPIDPVCIDIPIYREVTRALDDIQGPHPFILSRDLNPNIYHDITPNPSEGSGLVHLQVDTFSYYQDAAQPYYFFHLPDSFKILRKPDAPHHPVIKVKFESENSVNLAYFAMPYTDPERLSKASDQLRQNPSFLAARLPPGVEGPMFQLLQIDPNKTRFYLGIPGQEGSSGPYQDRSKNVQISIIAGMVDQLELNLEGFQEIFNSLIGGLSQIFQGWVEVEVYKDKIEHITFKATMNDMVGDILDYKEEQDSASGGIKATIINAIESPVRINSLNANIKRGNSNSKGEIRGLNLPVQLKPGESLQFVVAPLEQLVGDGQAHASFDHSLDVLPDGGAIWDSIVDKSVPSKPREITIKTPVFKDPDASKDVLEFIVEFKSGKTVELTRDQDTVKTTLPLTPEDLRNLVLGNPDQNTFVYRVTAVSKDGHLTRGPDKTLDGDTIIVIGVD